MLLAKEGVVHSRAEFHNYSLIKLQDRDRVYRIFGFGSFDINCHFNDLIQAQIHFDPHDQIITLITKRLKC